MINKFFVNVPSSGSTMVEHLPYYLKVAGLRTTTAICIRREEMTKNIFVTVLSSDSTVVKHLPHRPKVKALCPATAVCIRREKM